MGPRLDLLELHRHHPPLIHQTHLEQLDGIARFPVFELLLRYVVLGIVLGMLAAYAINLALMNMYELPRMPLHYLPLGALLLWVLGQIAVFGPARRAAAVPPAVATRGA